MKDQAKSKAQLMDELAALRARTAELEARDEEFRRTGKALRESEQRFHEIAANIREVFWLFDWAAKKAIYVSPAYEEVWGRSIQDLYNRYEDWADSIHPDDAVYAEESFREIFTSGGGGPREYRIIRPDGAVRWVSDRGFAIRGSDGQVVRIAGVAEDITERKVVVQALRESEEKFRNITEQSLMAIVILQDDRIKYANEAATLTLGYSMEEILAWKTKDWFRFVHPDDFSFVAEQAIKQQAGDEDLVTSHEWRIVTKTGETRWIEAHATTILFEGRTAGLTAAVDITERKRTEEALRDSERLLADLIEFLPDPTGAIDSQGKVIAWNRAMAELSGIPAQDMMGKGDYEYAVRTFDKRRPVLADMVSWPDEEIRKYYPAFQRDGDRISNESYLPDYQGGTYLWAKAAPLYNASGEVIGAIESLRDTTAQRRAEQELASHRDHLEERVKERTAELEAAQEELLRRERLAVLGQLTASVSHELRNPLGVIRSSAFFLNRRLGDGDERVAKHLARIEEQVDACDSIVGDLLEYTRGRHAQPKIGEMNPWLEGVLDTITVPKDIELTRCLDSNLPPILFDQEKMRRVVVNLIENAIDAVMVRQEVDRAEEDAYKPIVRVFSQEERESVTIEVEDNGIGMDEETVERAFEPLFTTRARGTGLGLAIVQRIVEEHGGSVSMGSSPLRGTKVRIVLPKQR